jgi:P-type E1-E2 ATPase
MLEIAIPGFKALRLTHLVLDYNGTLALEGRPLPGVRERLETLAQSLEVHILTADTFGVVRDQMAGYPVRVTVIPGQGEAEAKAAYVRELGSDGTAAVGNGRNDALMLKEAALGVAVVQEEGAAASTVMAADVVAPTILAALDLMINRKRLVATLRT